MKDSLDFIVVGAQKAGTTSLFEYVRQHPEISVPTAKEAWYFAGERGSERGWEPYLERHFGLRDPRTKWGTFTPQYMWGGLPRGNDTGPAAISDIHTVPARIRAQLPDVKLIAILRDPTERAISHHAMAVLNRAESRPVSAALRERLRSEALLEAREAPSDAAGYITFGEYGRILSGYYDTFSGDQILVLYLADLQRDPGAVVRRIFQFVGVEDTDFMPTNLGTVYRRAAIRRRVPLLERHRLKTTARTLLRLPPVHAAWTRLPQEQRIRSTQIFDGATYGIDLWNRKARTDDGKPSIDDELLEALRVHYRDDGCLLAGLTGTRPPWTT